jgi:hypothetical protein
VRPVRNIPFEPPVVERRGPAQHRVRSKIALAADTNLIELWPDLAPGARSLELKVKRPDGAGEVLLWARQLRREWPTSFAFAQPRVLPKGSVLEAIAYFDGEEVNVTTGFNLTLTAADPAPAATAATASRRPASSR